MPERRADGLPPFKTLKAFLSRHHALRAIAQRRQRAATGAGLLTALPAL
jgi:hypothetical protein